MALRDLLGNSWRKYRLSGPLRPKHSLPDPYINADINQDRNAQSELPNVRHYMLMITSSEKPKAEPTALFNWNCKKN
jgi:hypothetical protein